MNQSQLYLPPEVLALIGEYCLEAFTERELWFSLAQVSSIFRDIVTREITHGGVNRQAFCLRGMSAQTSRVHIAHGLKLRYGVALTFDRFDADRPDLAVFRHEEFQPPSLSGGSDSDPYQDAVQLQVETLQGVVREAGGPGLGGGRLLPIEGDQREIGKIVRFVVSTPKRVIHPSDSGRTIAGGIEVGAPLDFEVVSAENGTVTILWFDWRKVWTFRVAALEPRRSKAWQYYNLPTRWYFE